MNRQDLSSRDLVRMITKKLMGDIGVGPAKAHEDQFYRAAALVIKELLAEKQRKFESVTLAAGEKQLHYLSMEFLPGRSMKNALYNLGLTTQMEEALHELGVELDRLYGFEPDAGLGNGGLGRLAACYMDAMASLGLPANGYSILYEYGIFRQKLVEGRQTELPDVWLPGGEVWLSPRPDQTVEIRFGGVEEESWHDGRLITSHRDYTRVMAVPYDLYMPGYDSPGVSRLRLWSAKGLGVDMALFNRGDYAGAFSQNAIAEAVSKVLYPDDSHLEGRILRLRQQYFLCAASISDILRRHLDAGESLESFPQKNAIHINDTHPVLAIPELMRILLDDCGLSWERVWDIVTKTFAYTNHTVMREALESWDEGLLQTLLPRIHRIVKEIDNRFCRRLREDFHLSEAEISSMAILNGGRVYMANLAVAASHSVNGVSKLHSRLITETIFTDYFRVAPEKFTNVTNGIASRRWLCQANPGLTALITDCIGDGFQKDFSRICALAPFGQNQAVLVRLEEVKLDNKRRFSNYMAERHGFLIDPASVFDVQVKRLHEYKRQHLNALHILSSYLWLRENPGAEFLPRTYIFGAKAAPGYVMAKEIIRMIYHIGRMIDADPAVRGRLKVVYLEDYNVTLSELLMPASEISEQISLAGTEASGTGNMKLMLNGAITLGTRDGANLEIGEAVGDENILNFGMTADEVESLRARGYDPGLFYSENPVIKASIDLMESGIAGENFVSIAHNLRETDPYMVLADFDSYSRAQQFSTRLYGDRARWNAMSLANIASSGIFCADRAVADYARRIWGMTR